MTREELWATEDCGVTLRLLEDENGNLEFQITEPNGDYDDDVGLDLQAQRDLLRILWETTGLRQEFEDLKASAGQHVALVSVHSSKWKRFVTKLEEVVNK